MFNDPRSVHYDKYGSYYDKKTLASHIGIGKNLTWEQAQEVYRADINHQGGLKNRYIEEYKNE